ncbi:c-type cytochrome [Inquilinus limosus]|uniref:c-type cytochrome n=1 Tax=Inquilinus limosus TaxID=171674 RepID=UPI0004246E90|nr:c-type cytochrome [Inquilinus limosus]
MKPAWIAGLALLAAAAPAVAQDAAKGQQIYTVCASCHGGDGRATTLPQYPKIGGQNQAYLVIALKAYRDGKRQGTYAAMMAATAKGLSDQEIADVAAYVAALGKPD